MEAVGSFRYMFVKALCCPTPFLPACTPLIGGKALLELLLVAAGTAVVVAMVISASESTQVGNYADYIGVVMILLALRRLSFMSLIGISFERSIFWHKVVGAFYLFALLIHGLTIGEKNATGLVLGVLSGATALAYGFAYFQISFNLFYYFHIAVYIILAPIVVIHGGKFFGLVAIIWAADWIIRYIIQGKGCTAELSLLSDSIIKLNIPQSPYSTGCGCTSPVKPGMYCFIMIPKINYYEYHPFSIASGPSDDSLTFYIKAEGDWTEKLRDLAKAGSGGETGGISEVPIYLEGPYGNLSIDVFNAQSYPVGIFVSGGVGITPMLGMLKHAIRLSINGSSKFAEDMSHIIFVWACRDKAFADKLYEETFAPLIAEYLVKVPSKENVYKLKNGGELTFEFHLHVTEKSTGANPNSTKQRQVVSAETAVVPSDGAGIELGTMKASARSDKDKEMLLEKPVASHWKKGRPNCEALFAAAAKSVEEKRGKQGCCSHSRVSVSVCGPSPLIHNMRSQTVASSSSTGVTFDLHEELFFF